jgi:hypothetical protein
MEKKLDEKMNLLKKNTKYMAATKDGNEELTNATD